MFKHGAGPLLKTCAERESVLPKEGLGFRVSEFGDKALGECTWVGFKAQLIREGVRGGL